MSTNINYTQKLKEDLYTCIKACQDTHNVYLKATISGNNALDLQVRKAYVSTARSSLESCKKTIASCSAYISYATEKDSTTLCNTVVEKCNICIKIFFKFLCIVNIS